MKIGRTNVGMLAFVMVLLAVLGAIAMPGLWYEVSWFFIPSEFLAALGAILAYLVWRRSRRPASEDPGTSWALAALLLSFMYLVVLLLHDVLVLASGVIALLGVYEIQRIFRREARRRVWPAFALALALAGLIWFAFEAEYEFLWLIGCFGILQILFLPGYVLFSPSPKLTAWRKALLVSVLYFIAAASVWKGWEQYGLFRLQREKAKIPWTKVDIRNLAVNLETYFIDHSLYPPAVDEDGKIIAFKPDGSTVSAGYVPWMLTTPIPYAAALPVDRYHQRPDGTRGLYRYATNGTDCWIIASDGPDADADIKIEEYPIPSEGNCSWKAFMSQHGVGNAIEYDATNGAMSSGDVVRVGP